MNEKLVNNPLPPGLDHLWYECTHFLGLALFGIGFGLRVEGTRHMPHKGPVLVLANHQSYFDPWLAGMAVRRHLVYLARKTLFKDRTFSFLIRSLNAVPIDQDGVGREGLKTVVKLLKQERAVIVFPEGERCPEGKMLPLRPGVHLILRQAECTVLPVGIAGAYQALPRWRAYPVPSPLFLPPGESSIAVVVGKPLDSRVIAKMPREEALTTLYDAIATVQTRAEKIRRK